MSELPSTELQPYLEYFDRLLTDPRMAEYPDRVAWWRRVTGKSLTETERSKQ